MIIAYSHTQRTIPLTSFSTSCWWHSTQWWSQQSTILVWPKVAITLRIASTWPSSLDCSSWSVTSSTQTCSKSSSVSSNKEKKRRSEYRLASHWEWTKSQSSLSGDIEWSIFYCLWCSSSLCIPTTVTTVWISWECWGLKLDGYMWSSAVNWLRLLCSPAGSIGPTINRPRCYRTKHVATAWMAIGLMILNQNN